MEREVKTSKKKAKQKLIICFVVVLILIGISLWGMLYLYPKNNAASRYSLVGYTHMSVICCAVNIELWM